MRTPLTAGTAILCLATYLTAGNFTSKKADTPPTGLRQQEFQRVLQRFVDRMYLKAFRHIGDERDFDHGHILYGKESTPVAILYHTQELAETFPKGSDFSYIDPHSRNWIQWLDGDKIENADHYIRKTPPSSAYWRWFYSEKVPVFQAHHTIVEKMLDPVLVGADTSRSVQWIFTRVACGQADSVPSRIDIRLPTGENVCLSLGQADVQQSVDRGHSL